MEIQQTLDLGNIGRTCYICGRAIKAEEQAVNIGGGIYRHARHSARTILATGKSKYTPAIMTPKKKAPKIRESETCPICGARYSEHGETCPAHVLFLL
jgi:hypothetical protein